MNYDNWKLSNPIDDGDGYNMVSRCCGCSYENSTITDCCQVEMKLKYLLETDSTEQLCPDCGDHTDCSGYVCNECGNWFEETEEEHEYNERMKENYIEDNRNEY